MEDIIRTGIEGLDTILAGGVMPSNCVLIEGEPGTGKTTLGWQYIYTGITNYDQPGIIVTFEELPQQIYRDAARFGWDLQRLERANKLRVICTSPEVMAMAGAEILKEAVLATGARRVVVDSISHLDQVLHGSELRQCVYSLCQGMRRMQLHPWLIKEVEREDQHPFEEFLVDTVIRLYNQTEGMRCRRRVIEVLKSRGQDHLQEKCSFSIEADGVHVQVLGADQPWQPVEPGPWPTGIKGLDQLVAGGFPPRRMVLVSGEAGTGKTAMALQFLVWGARYGQQRGLYYSCEEDIDQLQASAALYGWDLQQLQQDGMLDMIYSLPHSGTADAELDLIVQRAAAHQARRVVIDSLPCLLGHVIDPLVVRGRLYWLSRQLKALGCTVLVLHHQEHLGTTQFDVDSVVDGVIKLSFHLDRFQRQRRIELVKLRGWRHTLGAHRMEIGRWGIRVYPQAGVDDQ